MADLVGEAYVRIHADTKFMKRAIRRDMDSIGKEGANSLLESFDQTLRQSSTAKLKNAQRTLADAIAGGDFTLMLRKSGKSVDDFVTEISADLRRLGNSSKITFNDMDEALESLNQWADKQRLTEEFESSWRAAERLNKTIDAQAASAQRLAEKYDSLELQALRHDIQQITKAMREEDKAFEDAHLSALKMNKAMDANGKSTATTKKHMAGLRTELARLRTDTEKISLAGGIGAIFGRGSRNNFLNFIGSTARNMTLLGEAIIRLPVRVLQSLAEGAGQVSDKFSALRKAGMSLPAIIGTGLLGAVAIGGPALIALAASASAVAVTLPALAAAISLITAGITAMASAITFATAGALLPLVPILASLLPLVGPLAVAISDMGNSATASAKALKPFTTEWERFKKAMQPFSVSFSKELAKWAPMLRDITPFMKEFGESINGAFRYFREGMQSPEMDKFFEQWGDKLPGIFDDVSAAITHMTRGLIAFFTPVLPYAERLASKFEDMMVTFDQWASSAEGQDAISEFMERAWTAADRLVGILGNVTGAISNILGMGQEAAGGDFLAWLEDITEQFEIFTSTPEGKQQIRQWFEDAKAAGETFASILGNLGRLFDELDSPEGRQMLSTFLDFMNLVTSLAPAAGTAIDFMATNLAGLEAVIGAVQRGFESFIEFMEGRFNQFVEDMQQLGSWIVAPFKWAWEQLFGNSYIPDIVNGFASLMPQIPTIIQSALATVGTLMTAPFRLALQTLNSLLSLLPPGVQRWLSATVRAIPGALSAVVGFMTAPFRTAGTAIAGILGSLAGIVSRGVGALVGAAARAVSGVVRAISGPFQTARDTVARIMGEIQGFVSRIPGLRAAAEAARTTMRSLLNATIDRFNALPLPDVPRLMAGGIVAAPRAIAGEAGREAVIPLDRPLSQIDPSVREMAALLRGRATRDVARDGARIIENVTFMIPNADPRLAAEAVMDRFVVLTT